MIGKALFPDTRYSLAFVLNLLAGRPFQQSESRLQHFLGPFNRFELSEPFFLSRHAAKVRSEMLFPQYQIPSSVFLSFPANSGPFESSTASSDQGRGIPTKQAKASSKGQMNKNPVFSIPEHSLHTPLGLWPKRERLRQL